VGIQLFTELIKNPKFITIIKIIIGLGIFLYLISTIQFSTLVDTFLQIKIIYLFPILFLVFFSILIRSFRWQMILQRLGIKQSIHDLFKYSLIGTFFASITPAKIGDFSKAYYIWKNRKSHVDKSLISVIVDRVFDILTLLFFGLIATIYFPDIFYLFPILLSMIVSILVIIILVIFGQKHILNFISKIFLRKIKIKSLKKSLSFFKRPSFINKLFCVTVLNWLTIFFQAEFLILAFNQQINILQSSLLISMVMIITLIPITISGFGTREFATVYFFSLVGIGITTAISFSLLWTFFGIILPAFIGGILTNKA